MKEFRKTNARNYRNVPYKYYKVSDDHSYAVIAGRCKTCKKITDFHCDSCGAYICENHYFTDGSSGRCDDCKLGSDRELTKQEKRKIRKAKLDV